MTNLQQQLSAPFPLESVKFRAGATNGKKATPNRVAVPATRALALAYIDSRDVQNRLDNIFGLDGWWDEYTVISPGQVECALTLVINGRPITKRDAGVGDDSKAAYSDALKRASVKFGIGRYLYDLPDTWVACEERGRGVYLKETPALPGWALPDVRQTAVKKQQPKVPTTKRTPHPPVPEKMRREFHAVGREVYGSDWNSKRAALCVAVSDGETNSSKDLNAQQMQTLIDGMREKKAKMTTTPNIVAQANADLLGK